MLDGYNSQCAQWLMGFLRHPLVQNIEGIKDKGNKESILTILGVVRKKAFLKVLIKCCFLIDFLKLILYKTFELILVSKLYNHGSASCIREVKELVSLPDRFNIHGRDGQVQSV